MVLAGLLSFSTQASGARYADKASPAANSFHAATWVVTPKLSLSGTTGTSGLNTVVNLTATLSPAASGTAVTFYHCTSTTESTCGIAATVNTDSSGTATTTYTLGRAGTAATYYYFEATTSSLKSTFLTICVGTSCPR